MARPAADQLLETITVDAGRPTVTTGTAQLKTGTKYELHVSGTFTLANGLRQTFDEDALYCSATLSSIRRSAPPRCGSATSTSGSGSSSLQNIDSYQEPAGGGTPLGYSVSHRLLPAGQRRAHRRRHPRVLALQI